MHRTSPRPGLTTRDHPLQAASQPRADVELTEQRQLLEWIERGLIRDAAPGEEMPWIVWGAKAGG